MEDTDWRPTPCRSCGVMREAARNPECHNAECVDYYRPDRGHTINKDLKQYLWIKSNRIPIIISNPLDLYKDPEFDQLADQVFQIGPEVKIEVSVTVKPVKPVYRS